ncbi:MAG: prepilin-type N-terminal cleavage/methylation domain-containing protein, partial [Acidobacteriota bacterium]
MHEGGSVAARCRRWPRRPGRPLADLVSTAAGSPSGPRRAAGFTLVEVLVATGLVGMVALAVAPLMLMAVQTSAVAQESTELTALGAERMEILRALPFADPQLAGGGSLTSSAAGYSVDPVNGDANRYIRWQITDENPSRKHVRLVTGVRDSIWGPPREVTLETFRTDL